MLQLLRNAFGNGGVEQCQMPGDVGIFVNDIHKHIVDGQRDGELFPAFPNERLFFGFAGRWQIINFSPSQMRAATTSVTKIDSFHCLSCFRRVSSNAVHPSYISRYATSKRSEYHGSATSPPQSV